MVVYFSVKKTDTWEEYFDEWASSLAEGPSSIRCVISETAVAGIIKDEGIEFTFSGLFINEGGDTSWEDLKVCPVLGGNGVEDLEGFDDLEEAIDYYTDKYADELGKWV